MNLLDISDTLNEAMQAIESLHHITILLMDAMKANNDESGEQLLYCYYQYIIHLYELIKSLNKQGEFIIVNNRKETEID